MGEINRRTGLGAILGGLFAAPTAAKEVAHEMSKVGSFPPPSYKGNTAGYDLAYSDAPQAAYPTLKELAEKEQYQVKHMRENIRRIKDIISGEYFKTEDFIDSHTDNFDYSTEHSLDSLKSVSKVNKLRMAKEYRIEKIKERERKRAIRELEEYHISWAKNKLWGKVSDLFE